MYFLLQKMLFSLEPELAHTITINGGKFYSKICTYRAFPQLNKPAMAQYWGLSWPNRVGLAAGFDKSGDCIDSLGHLGFGFIEVGTITPKPQLGNSKPRLFRLVEQKSIINRMGFNNAGCQYLVQQLKKSRFIREGGIVGVNIGRQSTTTNEQAYIDYIEVFSRVYPWASYVVVNISSPNTKNLADLQSPSSLAPLIESMQETQILLRQKYLRRVPLLFKISPDLRADELEQTLEVFASYAIDGLVLTNTTVTRSGLSSRWMNERGGLSGNLLYARSNHILAQVKAKYPNLVIIGVGGISSGSQAVEKMTLGADLVQFYTGLIYKGPSLIKDCIQATSAYMQKNS